MDMSFRIRDLSEAETSALKAEIGRAPNAEALRRIGDKIVDLTAYGSSQVLSTEALAHTFALSGLPRAAALCRLIDERAHRTALHGEPLESEYHGYREALNQSYVDPDERFTEY